MDVEKIIINTEEGNLDVKRRYGGKVVPVVTEKHPILDMVMPEYVGSFKDVFLREVISNLKETKRKYNGLGLSAPQCGYMMRVFVIGYNNGEDSDIVCINPKLVGTDLEEVKMKEGCLSYVGLRLDIRRPKRIQVEYHDEEGRKVLQEFDGLTSRCFQHELDHLNGIRFTSYVGRFALSLAKQKRNKIIKSILRKKS